MSLTQHTKTNHGNGEKIHTEPETTKDSHEET